MGEKRKKKATCVVIIFTLIVVVFVSMSFFSQNALSDVVRGDADESKQIPILMYHSFTKEENPEGKLPTVISVKAFQNQLDALSKEGYQTVTYEDLINYVYHNGSIPKKPVVISIDDGYRNVLELAVPVLEEFNYKATIAVIGCSVGKEVYKDTEYPIIPHFSFAEAEKYVEKGVIELQSHSYDMHQVPSLDGPNCRQGVLKKEEESSEVYIQALTNDYIRSRNQILTGVKKTPEVFTYPKGLYDDQSERILHFCGVKVTVTMDSGMNNIRKDYPESLYLLKRVEVTNGMTGAELLELLNNYSDRW